MPPQYCVCCVLPPCQIQASASSCGSVCTLFRVTLMKYHFESFVVSLCISNHSVIIHLNFFINANFFQYILKITSIHDLHYFHDILRRNNRVVFLRSATQTLNLILVLHQCQLPANVTTVDEETQNTSKCFVRQFGFQYKTYGKKMLYFSHSMFLLLLFWV